MRIGCHCGGTIRDNYDFIPYKGRVIGDKDWCRFTENILPELEDVAKGKDIRQCAANLINLLSGQFIWECQECGRLYADNENNDLIEFKPANNMYNRILDRLNPNSKS